MVNQIRVSGPDSARAFVKHSVGTLSSRYAGKDMLLLYSGGVASAVCAALLQRAEGVHPSSVLVDFRLPHKTNANIISKQYREQFGGSLEVLRVPDSLLNESEHTKDPRERDRMLGSGLIDVISCLARERGISIVVMGTTREATVAEKRAHPNHHSHSLIYRPFGTDIDVTEPVSLLSRDEVRLVATELGLQRLMKAAV